ncbi:segregation/condensation protein A [uncultured Clostridium sp.]|uniref:segregation/condensation protein A n=1 Tax=uncultured Clostridium sp. TaxID=59620 RepID=UPI00260A31DD|nr:segregation/condensation protein A [uncultured Clostridium sp.]
MNIKIDDFEGPFDLLLHLIRKNKMDIYNVEIFKITNQYLDYLNEMKKMDLEITSEFIVIAATLIEIKSKSLLPKIKKDEANEDEEDIEKKLLEKLIIYRKIKASTEFFKEKSIGAGYTYSKKAEVIEVKKEKVNNDDIFENITLIDLYSIYNKLIENYLKKRNNNIPIIGKNIKRDEYKIEDKYDYILNVLQNSKKMNFSDLMYECTCKIECVVTFLALLELMKQRKVLAHQIENFDEIIVERIEEDEY